MAKRSETKDKKGKTWGETKFAFRIFLRDYTLLLSTILTIVCIIMIIFGALALFVYDTHQDWLPLPLRDWVAFLHGANKSTDPKYDLCVFPLGVLIILFSGWYMASDIVKRARFSKIIDTESKAEFLENMDEVEKLAWELSSKHELMVMDKKTELGIDKKRR